VAYAEAGRFDEAIAIAQHALRLAEARFDSGLVSTIEKEVRLYQMHQALP
jgi:hypothetical protein